tara:strand:- start:150 stop:887 length:738 start_codon:yes stop_codon:yes gene_type:complete
MSLSGFDVECESCHLLGGIEQNLVQGACLLLGFGTLLLKQKVSSKTKRSWKVWFMDVSKQGFSGAAAHIGGMVNAKILLSSGSHGDECSWYLISFTFDTFCGVLLGYIMLNYMLQPCAKRLRWTSLEESGNYINYVTNEVSCLIWFKQMLSWVIITIIARAMVGGFLYVNEFWLGDISLSLSEVFECNQHVFLVLVMLGGPLILNGLQLWIQDTFLKESDGSYRSCFTKQKKREPALNESLVLRV